MESVSYSTQNIRQVSRNQLYDEKIEIYPKAISTDLIAQTRAIMESGTTDDKGVSAELSAHSPSTHEDVYLSRSDISKKSDCDHGTFGSDVGDKMYDLAKKMGELVQEEPEYNRVRLIAKLGLSTASPTNLEGSNELNEVIRLSKKTGYGTGLNESLNYLSDIVIVQDPTIAAVIISFINHLHRVKSKLIKEGSHGKYKLATAHQIYLESLLERFHRKHIKKGKELAKSLTLPYRKNL